MAGRAAGAETVSCQVFRGTLGAKAVVCKPADSELRGLVERVRGWLQGSFLPGRSFSSALPRNPADQAVNSSDRAYIRIELQENN